MNPNLSKLSNSELLKNTLELVSDERRVMTLVLEHLLEIETRYLFAKEGYSSLFEYCQKALGYSESEAYHRISSMRLMKQIPSLKEKLESGRLTISTLSLAQSVFRKEKMKFKTIEDKQELLTQFESQSKRACERIVAGISPESLYSEKEKVLNETMTEIRIPVNEELFKKIKKLQALSGKSSYTELLESLADEALKKKDPDQNPRLKVSFPPSPFKVKRRVPGQVLRREVLRRDDYRCSWIDPKSGNRCEATRHLQLDHVKPWSIGGETTLENLRVLCFSHNQLSAYETFGVTKIETMIREKE